MTSFFSPVADTGIPTARSDEKGVSFAMGVEMAKQWQAAFPKTPIVMVEEGWPNNPEVKSGRTDPLCRVSGRWIQRDGPGLPGCKRGRRSGQAGDDGSDYPAPQSQPDVRRSRGSAEAAMVALQQAGRGKFANGKPLTEIVAGVDFDATQLGKSMIRTVR